MIGDMQGLLVSGQAQTLQRTGTNSVFADN